MTDGMTPEQKLAEAEHNHLQATFILHSLQANLEVYGSNSGRTGETPADVQLALRYVNAALEHFPDNVNYLNTKALLVGEGLEDMDQAAALLERALAINPRDITVQNNLEVFKKSGNTG